MIKILESVTLIKHLCKKKKGKKYLKGSYMMLPMVSHLIFSYSLITAMSNQICDSYLHRNGKAPSSKSTIWKILISTSSGRFSPHLLSSVVCAKKELASSLDAGLFSSLGLTWTVFLLLTAFPFPLLSFRFLVTISVFSLR